MEDTLVELIGRYTIEAGLMMLCGLIAYKLGSTFIEKHFTHIQRMEEEHGKAITKIMEEHREERDKFYQRMEVLTGQFTDAIDHLKREFSDVVRWKEDLKSLYQNRK